MLNNLLENLFAAFFRVENAKGRLVGEEDLSAAWYGVATVIISISKAKELHSADGYSVALQEVNVRRQFILDTIITPKANVVIAADENLVRVGQFDEPIDEVEAFLLRPQIGEVAGVDHDVGLGHCAKPLVQPVSVGEVEYFL